LWSDRQVTVMPPFSRGVLAGLLLPLAAGLPLAGFGLQYVPDSTFPGTVARILESAGPQLLLASVLPILALALVGARRLAGLCLLLAIGSGAALVAQRRAEQLPVRSQRDHVLHDLQVDRVVLDAQQRQRLRILRR